MIEFEEFKPFFDAMIEEMQFHYDCKGDSWKDGGFYDDAERYVDMDDWLRKCLRKEVMEYHKSRNPCELIDIANFCAMMYLRGSASKEIKTEADS